MLSLCLSGHLPTAIHIVVFEQVMTLAADPINANVCGPAAKLYKAYSARQQFRIPSQGQCWVG